MSFNQIHRPFFDIISILGNAPISPNRHGLLQRSIPKTCYSLTLTIVLCVSFTIIVARHLVFSFAVRETNGMTLFLVVSIRELISCIMFAYIMIVSVSIAMPHARLLNSLVDLEQSVAIYLERFNSNITGVATHYRAESNWTAAALILWQLAINAGIVYVFGDYPLTLRLLWTTNMQFCVLLYVRMLIIVFTRELRLLRICFGQNEMSLLAGDLLLVDQVGHIKKQLVQVFSGIIVMNFLHDMLTMLVTGFWWIFMLVNYGSSTVVFDAFYVLGGYVLPFWIKSYLVTKAAEAFAAEVRELDVKQI